GGIHGEGAYKIGQIIGIFLAFALLIAGLHLLFKSDPEPANVKTSPKVARDEARSLKRALKEAIALEEEGDIEGAIAEYRKVARRAGAGHPSGERAGDRISALEGRDRASIPVDDEEELEEVEEIEIPPIQVACACGKTMKVRGELAGKKIR